MAAGEQVVPASELAAAMKQIKELQRLLDKKTMENELFKEAVEYGLSTTDEKWLFRNLGGDFHASGLMTLCLSSSNPARPYIWRFNIFRRFT